MNPVSLARRLLLAAPCGGFLFMRWIAGAPYLVLRRAKSGLA